MTIEIKAGTLSDFFCSAKETAKEIDNGEIATPKHTIWVEAKDLMLLLKPERTQLIRFFRKEKKVVFSHLVKVSNRSPGSLNNDLKILSKYELVHITKESNPGHGMNKVIYANFGDEKIELRVEM
ncbi:MAG: hypothetical protein R8J85_00395 [Mariprofundales bacterium]